MNPPHREPLASAVERAATRIAKARAVLIGAGAGMGVDSGLPDFRGPEGFWRAYPPLARRGLRFEEMANPRWFDREPHLAWAFYGHRLRLYRQTRPHAGFQILRQLAGDRPLFVFTSNVDGAFQAAGFDDAQIYEIHGSIHYLQRTDGRGRTWSADGVEVDVDMDRFEARDPLPTCPVTGQLARPNILMFNDWRWRGERSEAQAERYAAWLERFDPKDLVIIEIGAGTAVPSVRNECSRRHLRGASLIRINPREPHAPRGAVSLPLGALDALTRIAAH